MKDTGCIVEVLKEALPVNAIIMVMLTMPAVTSVADSAGYKVDKLLIVANSEQRLECYCSGRKPKAH